MVQESQDTEPSLTLSYASNFSSKMFSLKLSIVLLSIHHLRIILHYILFGHHILSQMNVFPETVI